MFRFLPHFNLRVIGTDMTLPANLRRAGLRNAERVARVACRARTLTAIRVNATNARVGPRCGIELARLVFQHGDGRPVALLATGVRGAAANDFTQRVVETADEFGRIRVAAREEFRTFPRVASLTVLGRNEHDDFEAVVIFYIRAIALVGCAMTGVTVHARADVFAASPVFDDAGGDLVMAAETGLPLFRNLRRRFRYGHGGELRRRNWRWTRTSGKDSDQQCKYRRAEEAVRFIFHLF